MKEQYTLAVVIPCWNEEEKLPLMLDCIIKQTYQDWRVYCVDDQSTDSTAEIIKSYAEKDSRIRYFCRNRQPKGGQTCRNIGIELAEGAEYLIFFDADDLVAPYCFEQRVSFMTQNPDLDCGVFPIFAFVNSIYEDEGCVFGVKIFDDDLKAMLAFTLPFQTATNIYRYKSLIAYNLRYDEQIKSHQDVEFNIQFVLSGMKYAFDGEAKADYFYQVGTNGVASKIYTKNHFDSHIHFIDKTTQAVSAKYGNRYDFYLEAMIVNFLGYFRRYWKPYFDILRLSWVKKHPLFSLRIILYLLILKTDRRLIFYKHRKYTKRQSLFWKQQSFIVWRKRLLERGIES